MGSTKIENYDFGTITVGGNTFTKDIIVCNGWIFPNWRRKEGHLLHMDDIESYLDVMKPNLVIFGTGSQGMMNIPDIVLECIRESRIQVYWDKTYDAVKYYNDDYKDMIVMGAFHLTC